MSAIQFRRWYLTPLTVALLGLTSVILLIWTRQLSEEQHVGAALDGTIKDVQLKTTLSHLWLEEYIGGETSIDVNGVLADIDSACKLMETVMQGGASGHGMALPPIDPELREKAEALSSLLSKFKGVALVRLQERESAGVGTVVDDVFDGLFREIIDKSKALEVIAEREQARAETKSRRLFTVIFALWVSTVVIAVTGFWNRELQKKMADNALRDAHDELEHRVEARTVELEASNRNLHLEVAERQKAEEGIRVYEEVVKNMPIGLYVCQVEKSEDGRAFRIIATNPIASHFSGIPMNEILGKTIAESFPSVLETNIPEVYKEVVLSGKAMDLGEFHFEDDRVAEGHFWVKAFPLPHDCVGVIFENISERKKVEEALRESEGKFRRLSLEFNALLDAIPDRLALLSPDLKILWANRGAAKAAGESVSSLAGRYCHEVGYGLSARCDECPARSVFLTGAPANMEVAAPDGTVWAVRLFPIKNEEGKTVNIIELATDVTEKIALQTESMRAAHLASIGELAAGVAHEVNNPINGIINYAQILADETEKGSTANDIAGRIKKEGIRIATIVRGLLSFARERKEEKMPARVDAILSDALILTESQMKKHGIKLHIDLPEDLPDIIVNAQQIQQVFLNVITNARYALNEKYPGEHEDKILEISAEQVTIDETPFVRMSFRDHGTGIPHDLLDKIMIPFFSTKPKGKGTGLGLCISHGIVTDHGGKLMVDSTEGEYTRVAIILPIAETNDGEHPHN